MAERMAQEKRKYPVFNKEFGRYLQSLRGGMTGGELNQRLRSLKMEPISSQQLSLDEKGQIKDIPAARLRAYAAAYRVPFEALLLKYTETRYGVELNGEVAVRPVLTSEEERVLAAAKEHPELMELAVSCTETNDPQKIVDLMKIVLDNAAAGGTGTPGKAGGKPKRKRKASGGTNVMLRLVTT